MKITFTKTQALGNDFIVIDTTYQKISLNIDKIKLLCHRKLGIGCDQLLIINQKNDSPNNFDYKIFNADGSTAKNCGNGARCIISYVYNNYLIDKEKPINLFMADRKITGVLDGKYFTINMGGFSLEPEDIPFIHTKNLDNHYNLVLSGVKIEFGIIYIGNPHLIIKLENELEMQDIERLEKIAKLLQGSVYFPDSINVNFYWQLNQDTIKLITYERGCGFTNACGTGACATAVYCIIQSKTTNKNLDVLMDGGSIKVQLNKENHILMTGPANEVFHGSIII